MPAKEQQMKDQNDMTGTAHDSSTGNRRNESASDCPRLSRRNVLRGAGGALAVAALPGGAPRSQAQTPLPQRRADLTGRLARYMAEARDLPLPASAVLAAKHRILDTFAAIVSGGRP